MKQLKTKLTLISSLVASIMLTGCGGAEENATSSSSSNTQVSYFVDSPVQGVTYTCGSITGTTDANGQFSYDSNQCSIVSFSIGGVSLGEKTVDELGNE